MHWKIKSLLQNGIAKFPERASYEAYYQLQRRFGALRRVSPISRFTAGVETCKRIIDQSKPVVGRVFLEVGTGRAPLVPIAYWLMGASRTITVDLNRYLKSDILRDHLEFIGNNSDAVAAIFGELLDRKRFDELLRFVNNETFDPQSLMHICSIEYIAPGDATATGLPDASVDYHTSFTVFEHIPPDILVRIVREGNRVLAGDGLFVHCVDYSDHFSHSDKNISSINFLQYSEKRWNDLAGNRYMYMNRMRHDDMLDLLVGAGHEIFSVDTSVDVRAQHQLQSRGIQLDMKFAEKSGDVLKTIGAWIVSSPLRCSSDKFNI